MSRTRMGNIYIYHNHKDWYGDGYNTRGYVPGHFYWMTAPTHLYINIHLDENGQWLHDKEFLSKQKKS